MRETDINWVRTNLKTILRLLGISNREVENRIGWCHGYLSRVFAGTLELRLDHILAILEVADLHPAEFFHLTWPAPAEPTSPAARELFPLWRRFQPAAGSPPPPAQPAELQQAVLECLRDELTVLFRQVLAESAQAPVNGSPPPSS